MAAAAAANDIDRSAGRRGDAIVQARRWGADADMIGSPAGCGFSDLWRRLFEDLADDRGLGMAWASPKRLPITV
jgi:hypothetical protein